MKKNIFAKGIFLVALLFTCIFASCSDNEESIAGKWIDNKTEGTIEYTSDGYYYEYANENFTTDKTKYKVENGKITYYLEGSNPDEGFSVPYEINEEGHLVIGGEIEYRPLIIPKEDEEK